MTKKITPFVFMFIISATKIFSQLNVNPAINNVVCTAAHHQKNLSATSDLNGGVIIAWEDYRADSLHPNIYAQRLDKNGNAKWAANGIPLFVQDSSQKTISMISDSSGGVIICWQDKRGGYYNLFTQRIDSMGNKLWASSGVAVAPKAKSQKAASSISDGNHGTIIVWEDTLGVTWKIYAQRLDGTGAALWAAGGVGICTNVAKQINPKLIPDGSGGAMLVWEDKRNTIDYDVYAQHINSSGASQWGPAGIFIVSTVGNQTNPKIKSDNAGGAIVVWEDYRNNSLYSDIYAQRVNASGASQWNTNGIAVCNAQYNQNGINATSVGINGIIVSWTDGRNDTLNQDIYAQRINLNGTPAWAANGIVVANGQFTQKSSTVSGDRTGGVFISWQDTCCGSWDIMSQRLDLNGNLLWTAAGVATGTAAGDQTSVTDLYDGNGGCIYVFEDGRSGIFNIDIYAYHLDANGIANTAVTEENFSVEVKCFPNPFVEETIIEITNANLQSATLKIYDMYGKEIFPSVTRSANKFILKRNNMSSGIYFYEIKISDAVSKGKLILTD